MAFYVGQKVIAVDASENPLYGPCPLIEGRVYTITRVVRSIQDPGFGLHVDGASHEPAKAFHPHRFRPAVEPNIQQFRDLVAPIFNRNRERESV